jgi:GNAT superfamily N-acetyltransferase
LTSRRGRASAFSVLSHRNLGSRLALQKEFHGLKAYTAVVAHGDPRCYRLYEPFPGDHMSAYAVTRLSCEEARLRRAELVELLVDAVESGASVNFIWPMTQAKAEAWWDGALASHARGERLIFAAESEQGLEGTVQLILAPQENQSFRADVAKMLVHRRARRRGLGAALLSAVEEEARRIGRTLLTLDTETGSAGERLYASLGWTKFGEVPGYAARADNSRREAASFFFKSL